MIRFLFAFLPGALFAQPQTFDVILRNGLIVDGAGREPFRADLAVSRAHIVRVGNLRGSKAAIDLDLGGLAVAPGFINIHSHASPTALSTAVNMLTQGVTTEIVNADGGGPTDIASQLETWSKPGLAVNVGAYAGFNSIWASVVGPGDRRPDAAEIGRMRDLLVANLERGAWGVSAGLDYKPGYFARTAEVIDIVRAAASWRTNFTNHERVTPESKYSGYAGMAETIEIASKAGLMPVITHMKIQGHEQGSAARAIEMMRSANYAAADVYPYLAGQTALGALIIPGWAQEGGRAEMIKRFQDAAMRRRIVQESEEAIAARFGGAANIYIPAFKRKLTDVMRESNVTAGEAVVQIWEKEPVGAILQFGIETDLVKLLQNPAASIACDCGASGTSASHPRFFGTFPRVLGHYVRETKALTLAEAVRKMSGLPAATIGMVDRGFLAVGMRADITVFDPAVVRDNATYEEPQRPSDGIRHVLVNGRFALRDGKPAGEKSGMALRRSRGMISRPMDINSRAISLKRDGVSIDVGPGGRRGTLLVRDRPAKSRFEMTQLGMMQTHGQWTALTGVGKQTPGGAERPFVAIVDRSGDGGTPDIGRLVVKIEGLPELTVSIAASASN